MMNQATYRRRVWELLFTACAVICFAAPAAELDEFLARIADPSAEVRAEAWKAAGPLGAPAVMPLAKLAESSEPGISKAALAAIETITTHAGRSTAEAEREAVAQAIADAVEAAGDDQLRRELLHLLGLAASDMQIPLLAGLLNDAAVGEDARIALERIPGAAATGALIQALQDSPEECSRVPRRSAPGTPRAHTGTHGDRT